MPSTGNVASDCIDSPDELAELYSRLHLANPFLRTLPFAKAPYVRGGHFQSATKVRRDLLPRSIDFLLSYAKVLAFETVELARIAQQGRVAAPAHVIYDLGCRFFGTREIESSAVGEFGQHGAAAFGGYNFHDCKNQSALERRIPSSEILEWEPRDECKAIIISCRHWNA